MNQPESFNRAGAPTISSRTVFAIAVPTALGHITLPLLGIADTAFVGRLGDAVLLAGIALGTIVFEILFTMVNFLRSGTTALTAQAMGRRDWESVISVMARGLIIALVLGLLFILLQSYVFALLIPLIGGSDIAQATASNYLAVRVLSSPFALMNYVFLGWLIGQNRAGLGVGLQAIINLMNITLSWLFMFPLGFGFIGVAIGTVLAETLGALAGFVIAYLLLKGKPLPSLSRIMEWSRFKALFALNRDIMIRSLVLICAFAFFTAQGARQGDITLAANAVLLHIFLFGGYFLDGLAVAAEQMTGQSLGAMRRDLFARAVKLTTLWAFVIAAACSMVFWAGSEAYIQLITTDEAVREVARLYAIYAVLTPIVGVLAFSMDGVFIGATWSRDMRNFMVLSGLFYLGAWAVLMPAFGNHGLWLALLSFLGVRGITLLAILRRRINQSFSPF
jgi:MATE family multidrug resistance protein